MTTPSKIEAELKDFRDLLVSTNVAIAANPITIRNVGSVKRVTWLSPVTASGPATDFGFASIGEYTQQLLTNAYTVVLFDGSILQVSIDIKHNKIIGHRFSFFPCPFDLQPDDLVELPILDVISLYEESGRDRLRLRSPLRFEFDPNNTTENHPICHVHLLWAHCRCSVVAPLSLGHFIKFIFSNFYPRIWNTHSFLREWPTTMGTRTISVDQESILHLACRR
jgi:hypothetical protein